MAVPQPQAAYVALTKSLQCEWVYLQRVVPDCRSLFAPLENIISSLFLSAMFGCQISSLESELFFLPVRFGGLGILLPRLLANPLFAASRSATRAIVDSIRFVQGFELDVHDDLIVSAHRSYQQVCNDLYNDLFSTISCKLDPTHLRAFHRSRTNDLSCWLSVMPIEKDNFDLTAQEFRDALAI